MKLLLFALGALVANGCSPMPGQVWPTLEEEIEAATIVAYGTVTGYPNAPSKPGSPGIMPFGQAQAIVEIETYYKGSGACFVVVDGFRDSAACGVGIPAIGDKIVVFSCGGSGMEANTGYPLLEMNELTIHTGALLYGVDAAKLQEIAGYAKSKGNMCNSKFAGVSGSGTCCTSMPCLPKPCPLLGCIPGTKLVDTDSDGCGDVCQPCPAILCIGGAPSYDSDGDGCDDACRVRCPLLGCNMAMGLSEVDTDGDGCGDTCRLDCNLQDGSKKGCKKYKSDGCKYNKRASTCNMNCKAHKKSQTDCENAGCTYKSVTKTKKTGKTKTKTSCK